ncbi:MAG: hypothetical protein R3E79_35080 [Caldilineaceae bacterium]
MPTLRLVWTTIFILFLLFVSYVLNGGHSAAAQEPMLALPDHIIGQSGQSIQAPVDFTNGGQAIVGTTFSIDFDESCLALDTADNDSNGIPDGITVLAPSAFRTSVSVDTDDNTGELDITIIDYSPPFAMLPDQPLLQLDFHVICTPAPGELRHAPIVFSTLPRPSFSNEMGHDVTGSSQDGGVDVLGEAVKTPTPAETPLSTGTPTPIGTQPAQSTGMPTAPAPTEATALATGTLTAQSTPTRHATAPIEATIIPTVSPTATVFPSITATPFRLFMPLALRS